MSDIDLTKYTPKEKEAIMKILNEMSSTGSSSLMNNIISEDWKEVPVDIETFLHDPYYLGKGLTTAEGAFTLFPYWEELLKKIYPDPMKPTFYNTLALTGAIGLGKSTEAVIIGLYELYRMMCLKDPYVYYGIMNIDVISFAVINITLDAAQGVAWSKMQNLLQSSDWFMTHGELSKSDTPVWTPKGDTKIELICGSQPRHFIGRALFWCLDGDTLIATTEGDKRLKDLQNKIIRVYTVDDRGNIVISDECTVKPTAIETEEYEIELEDGSIIKCTPTHRFMLKDGTYKEARYLTEEDELYDTGSKGVINLWDNVPSTQAVK